MPLRAGAKRVRAENIGYCVLLFDEQHRETFEEQDVRAVLIEPDGSAEREARHKAIREQGQALALETPEDDGVTLEVHVGAPLTEQERKKHRALKPLAGRLNLPTGSMCAGAMPQRVGKTRVPPGDYTATIYHSDRASTIVLVLTPSADKDAPSTLETWLPHPYRAAEEEGLFRKYEVDKGLFLGHLTDMLGVTNLDRRAAQQMGLRVGVRLKVDHGEGLELHTRPSAPEPIHPKANKKRDLVVHYLPNNLPNDPTFQGGSSSKRAFFSLDHNAAPKIQLLQIGVRGPIACCPVGTPVRLEALPNPVFPAYRTDELHVLEPGGKVRKGLVLCGDTQGMYLNCGSRDFRAAGMREGQPVVLELRTHRHLLYFFETQGKMMKFMKKRPRVPKDLSKLVTSSQVLLGLDDAHWDFPDHRILNVLPADENADAPQAKRGTEYRLGPPEDWA